MSQGKWFRQNNAVQAVAAFLGAALTKLARHASRFEVRRGDVPARFWSDGEPFICVSWHGQHLLLPTFWHNWREARVAVARGASGEVVARLMHLLRFGTIRGPIRGAGAKDDDAVRAMVRALGDDISIVLTADAPPGEARRADESIVALAQASGRPVVPAAATTRAVLRLGPRSRYAVNLPFSRGAVVWGEPVSVPRDADVDALEQARQQIEQALNTVTAEADHLVGRASRQIADGGAGPAPRRAG